ncbi:GNAT family N-acetyltransferase [Nonomuraea sp. NPDC050663]|uniref:GNAT family N-acetyltransferase n=1 Tax=Nonomuraea sp. NPDC050663 TaxID=3364370 RepID=UPI0037B48024
MITSIPDPAAMQVVYAQAFVQPPWNESPEEIAAFTARFEEHRALPGFLCRMAWVDGELAGFTYGFDTLTDSRIYPKLGRDLSDRFELRELAVDPRFGGRGVGAALMTDLLTAAGPAWLLTRSDAVPAVKLYTRLGWVHTADVEGLRLYLSAAA